MKLNKVIIFFILAVILSVSCSTTRDASRGEGRKKKYNSYDMMYSKALEFYEKKRYDKALSLFVNVMPQYSGHARIDTIMFYSAICYFFERDYYNSSMAYDEYRLNMGRGAFAVQADLYYALSLYNISPDIELDQTYTFRAINAFKDFVYRNSGHDMIKECEKYIDELQHRMFESEVGIAQTYFDIGYHNSCIAVLRNILQENPNTPFREKIMFMMIEANYEYARSSIAEKRIERFYNTIEGYYKFIEEYPNSKLLNRAEKYHAHSKSYAEGTAVISDVTGMVLTKENKLYDKREQLMNQIERLSKRKNEDKLALVMIELDIVNKAIDKFEELINRRKRELEINQIG